MYCIVMTGKYHLVMFLELENSYIQKVPQHKVRFDMERNIPLAIQKCIKNIIYIIIHITEKTNIKLSEDNHSIKSLDGLYRIMS